MHKFYAVIASGLLLVYSTATLRGWEFTATKRETIPASVRNSPGGYRSYHFWHSGFHGGK
ncbi:MAG TPA: hypothetical protein VEZ11_12470 [Thermoanaerobaculia bacterium]|nr:hypothetical protein [Thermoanaerobaculia bacterium]